MILIIYHKIIKLQIIKNESSLMDTLQKRQNLDTKRVNTNFRDPFVHGFEILLEVDSQSRHYDVGS